MEVIEAEGLYPTLHWKVTLAPILVLLTTPSLPLIGEIGEMHLTK